MIWQVGAAAMAGVLVWWLMAVMSTASGGAR